MAIDLRGFTPDNAKARWYRWKTKKSMPFGVLGLI
jgi:hypothetical protein